MVLLYYYTNLIGSGTQGHKPSVTLNINKIILPYTYIYKYYANWY